MTSLKDLQAMSCTDLGKVRKDELIHIIKSHKDSETNGDDANPLILAELRAIRSSQDSLAEKITTMVNRVERVENDNQHLKTRMNALEEKVESQAKVISKQQGYLEQLDYRERGRNLVITGVPEDVTWNDADTDEGKLKAIFQHMEVEAATDNMAWRRIGSNKEGKHKPILVSVSSMQKRNLIALKSSRLHESVQFQSIRVKKDKHPAVRKEWQRLFEVEAAEKAKPENAGKTIEVDKKNRTVLCNGSVIDTWNLVFQ